MLIWILPNKDPRVAQLRRTLMLAVHFDRRLTTQLKLAKLRSSVGSLRRQQLWQTFGLEISAHVASGQPRMGHNVEKEKFCICQRRRREELWSAHEAIRNAKSNLHGRDGDHFLLLPTPVDLHGDKDVAAISAALPDLNFSLIAATLAMSMGGGSENDSALWVSISRTFLN